MTSPVVAALSQIGAAWESLTPQDRTSVTYHEADGRSVLAGKSGDRTFYFDIPSGGEIVDEAGPATTGMRWDIEAVVHLSASGRSLQTMTDAVLNESVLLMRSINTQSSWPSGVYEVITTRVTAERPEEKGDVLLRIAFTVHAGETD